MIVVKVTFVNYEWDNYQGASGKVYTREKIIELPEETELIELKSRCITELDSMGFVDNWNRSQFIGRGLIRIEIL